MKLFFISYDLTKPIRNYNSLYQKLNSMNAKRILESVWGIKGNYTAASLRDTLKNCIDADDRILIIENINWATFNALININNIQ